MHEAIYDRLKQVARDQGLITYGELAPLADLHMELISDRNKIAGILGDISTREHSCGHPLLSAVVVHGSDMIPGKGFFTLAVEVGIYDGSDDLRFFSDELKKVHEFWLKSRL